MAKLKKGNRVINVQDAQVDGYLNRGYDQISEKGKVTKSATGGKTVALPEYNKIVKENEELKAKAKEFADKGKKLAKENEELRKNQDNTAKEAKPSK